MGDRIFTEYDFEKETTKREISFERTETGEVRASETVAKKAQQQAEEAGGLHPSVDPAVQAIHRSLIRFEPYEDKFRVTVGCPIPIESVCDVTGSMGENVQIMFGVLPETYELISKALPGCDPQLSLGVFGDVVDGYVLERPQFEMTAEKIVEYCSHLFSSGNGGDGPEDPQYAVFGAAYLTDAYINRIGLKGYHFLVTDASMHGDLTTRTLKRIFGEDVLDLTKENGHEQDITEIMEKNHSYDMVKLHKDLNQLFHAFLIVIDRGSAQACWQEVYDENHIIYLGSTRYLPQVEAAIIGLTEATIEPSEVEKFLINAQVPNDSAKILTRQLLGIPYGEQRKLEQKSGYVLPKKGDLFATKTELQPCGFADEDADGDVATDNDETPSSGEWL
ncbi:MAG: hypothetical protein Q4B65_00180 [Candidatus Saccharibacteria bacterium]|nr:hypothetical protein [Candidatus Saccharibacteria bacterium]